MRRRFGDELIENGHSDGVVARTTAPSCGWKPARQVFPLN